jgi:hypothetical protein
MDTKQDLLKFQYIDTLQTGQEQHLIDYILSDVPARPITHYNQSIDAVSMKKLEALSPKLNMSKLPVGYVSELLIISCPGFLITTREETHEEFG